VKDGTTPIMIAAFLENLGAITVLNDAGANVDTLDKDGATPVFIASKKGHEQAITALVIAGANVDIPRKDGATPLLIAAHNGHAVAVGVLLEAGANASIKTSWGTALEVAKKGKKSGHPKIIRILENYLRMNPNGIKPVNKENFKLRLANIKTEIERFQSTVAQEPISGTPSPLTFFPQASAPSMQVQTVTDIASDVSSKDVAEFLTLVVEGEQGKAEAMLKSNPTLALASGDVTDLSKRTFTGITGFQYAVWALDWHMWTMIRKYLPDDEAKKQAQGFETGTWVKSHGVHAQNLLDNLVKAYQITREVFDATEGAEADEVWVQQVGGAQRLLPAHVVNEFCHPTRRFSYPMPNFKDTTILPRSRIFDKGEWFTALHNGGKLGEKFAVYRAGPGLAWAIDNPESGDNEDSIRILASIRMAQRAELVSQLKAKNAQKKVA
jgi:hypothetical protein